MCNSIARAVSRSSLTHTGTHASLCGVHFSQSCFCSSSSFSFPGALRTPSGPAAFSPRCTFLCRLSVLLSATVIPPSSSQRLSFLLSPHSWVVRLVTQPEQVCRVVWILIDLSLDLDSILSFALSCSGRSSLIFLF